MTQWTSCIAFDLHVFLVERECERVEFVEATRFLKRNVAKVMDVFFPNLGPLDAYFCTILLRLCG